jgi:hypothetical protein
MRYAAALFCLLLVGSACGGSSSSEVEALEERIEELEDEEQEPTSISTLPAASTTVAVTVPTTTVAVASTATGPVLELPFSAADDPLRLMPMGETVNHDPPQGHPGIDFQWEGSATVRSSLPGEVVQITQREPNDFAVSVINGPYVVHYNHLGSVAEGLDVGDVISYGETIGNPMPIQGTPVTMIHWEFGTYVMIGSGDSRQIVRTIRECPLAYFSDDAMQRLATLWTAEANVTPAFPYICSGYYSDPSHQLHVGPTASSAPDTSAAFTTTTTISPTTSTSVPVVRWNTNSEKEWAPSSDPPPCKPFAEVFSVFPIDTNLLTQFARPGRTGADGATPIYIAHGALRADNAQYDQIDVRFPAEGFSLYAANRRFEETISNEEQVKLLFHHPCGIQVWIDHLAKPTDRWASIIEDVPITTSSRITFMPAGTHQVQAGEVLANGIGHEHHTYLDFGVYDLRNKNSAAEMISNEWPEYRSTGDYAICWSTFFGPDTEQLLEGLPAGAVDTSDYCYG